jgi:DNA-binding CsgD family transcriptional regulator
MTKRSRRRKPTWFNPELDRYTEWAQIRIAPEHAGEWLHGVATVLQTPLWNGLVAFQGPLLDTLGTRDWAAVTPWELVAWLQVIGDIRVGIDTFLPAPYAHWPLEHRRTLYLTTCLIKAAAMVEERPQEDFGVPELAAKPPLARAIVGAAKPLWFELARPVVVATVHYWQQRHVGVDAALLNLLTRAEQRTERTWLPLLENDAHNVVQRLASLRRVQEGDNDFTAGQRMDEAVGQVGITVPELFQGVGVAEGLARSFYGEFNHVVTAVTRDLRDAHKTERRRNKVTVRFDVRDNDDEASTAGLTEDMLPDERPTPEAALIARERQQLAKKAAALANDPTLDRRMRPLLVLLRQDPTQSIQRLADRLQISKNTVRAYLVRLQSLLR